MEGNSRVTCYWGPLLQCKPVITSSSKYMLAAFESTVKVFNIASSVLLATLKVHQSEIIGIVALDNNDRFATCDEKGNLCIWNSWKEFKGSPIVETLTLDVSSALENGAVISSFLTRSKLDEIIVGVRHKECDFGKLFFFNTPLRRENPKLSFFSSTNDDVRIAPGKVGISETADFMVYLTKKRLVVKALTSLQSQEHQFGSREITCIACHPTDLVVATGDCSGRILLWHDIFLDAVTREFHWHAMPLADLMFSVTGAELYSGGGECVLLKWKFIEDTKEFVPRMGMPIKYVATDQNSKVIVCAHVDSAFTIVSAEDLQPKSSIQGLPLGVDLSEPYPGGIVLDPRTKTAVLNGKSGHIQFYDIHRNTPLYQLDVVQENYINSERDQKIYNTEVEKFALSPEGTWLATIEYRDDYETSPEVRLKFWKFEESKQSWFLNTCMQMPHAKYVNALTFDPSTKYADSAVCVSCSDDGKFKVWEVVDNSDIYVTRSVWKCRNVGFYRHLPATTATIAPDGSLITAGFFNVITVWTADDCHLKGTLSQPYLKESIRQIEFGRTESCGSMLVSRTENWLCGWNLFTCTLSWRVMLNSTCMAVDPVSSYIAVFSKNCDAFIFKPQNTLAFTRLENIIKKQAVCALFIPRQEKYSSSISWNEESQLFIIDEAQRLKLIEPKGDIYAAEAVLEGVLQEIEQDSSQLPAPTPFAALLAQSRASDVVQEKDSQTGPAAFGVNVQNSSSFLKQVLNDVRVYRLDDFSYLVKEFCQLVIPESETSEERKEREHLGKLLEKQGSGMWAQFQGKEESKELTTSDTGKQKIDKLKRADKKVMKRNLERSQNSNFVEFMEILKS